MVCYYHPLRQAVGVCQHCQRGICAECAAVVDDVLACRARHEERVHQSTALLRRQIAQVQRIPTGYVRNAIFYGLVAAAFLAFGVLQYRFLGLQAVFFMLIGLFLLYAAAANYLESRRYRE